MIDPKTLKPSELVSLIATDIVTRAMSNHEARTGPIGGVGSRRTPTEVHARQEAEVARRAYIASVRDELDRRIG